MYTIYAIAKWFLKKENNSTSPKKLQKLCWYAYSWYIALTYEEETKGNEMLFDEEAEAWVHGPVFRSLFIDYKYSNYERTNSAEEINDSEIIGFLNDIYNVYGSFSGFELESLTHQEKPWINARKGLNPLESSNKKIAILDIIDEYLPRLKVN
ncbi:Panacea domain-containing protein [Fusobacterium sp.]|uniref:Panacea domain-containing protein n=1 Tax=Fusobacterium sp. TaxID=68766 RepID=UPI002603B4B4|nr:type II toxin-antitoxin system antitoxin SocA domain-containing protein [Fusobacterium sp.]